MKNYFTVSEPAPGFYHISEPAGVCCSLITGDRQALLIDTGYGFGDLPALVREITSLPLQLVNTHCHIDHAGGNSVFSQPAYIHQSEEYVYDFTQHEKQDHLANVERKLARGRIPDPFPPGFDKEDYVRPFEASFLTAEDHQCFDLGGRTAEIIFLPGHTKGSLAVFDHGSGILAGGDNIGESLWIMFRFSASLPEFADRLKYIMDSYPVTGVAYSHSASLYPPQIMEDVLRGVRSCCPDSDSPFQHPWRDLQALHHKEPVTDIPGVSTIHIVYPSA
ncbi:MAG: MBL fold metallo-hydrolase [Emergencia sp.]